MTYDELVSSVLSTLEVDEPDIRAEFPNFVERTQLRIQQNLDINTSRRFFEATLNAGERLINVPAGTVVVRSVSVQKPSDNLWESLLHKDRSYLIDYDPTRAAVGDPRYYAFTDDDSISIVPGPSASTRIEASVIVRIPVLGPTIQTNWIGDEIPHVLLYGTLVEAAIFNKMDDADVARYEKMYNEAVAGTGNEVYRRNRTDEYREGTPKL